MQGLDLDADTEGITLDKQGELLKAYLGYDGFTAPFIEAYDYWITTLLPAKVMRTQLRCGEGTLFFPTVTPDYPRMGINEARDRNLTYNAELYADVAYRPPIVAGQPIPEAQRLGQVSLGKIPVLIGSSLSKVYGKTEEELLEMGEDPKDPNGYVINKGTERLVLIQEKLRMNRVFVFVGDKKGGKKTQAKGALVARMTCSTISGSTLVLLKEGKIKDVDLSLHFMGKNAEGEQNAVNVISAMTMLGTYIDEQNRTVDPTQMYSNLNKIIETVLQFSKNDPRWKRKVWIALQPSILRAAQLSQRGDHFDLLADKMFTKDSPFFKESPQFKRDRIIKGFMDELFPQIDPNAHLAPRKKYEMLAMMLSRFLEVLCGLRKADDRDNWGNKRLETAAIAIERLFNTVFDLSMKLTQKSIDDKKYSKENAIKGFSHQNVITDNFTSSFNSNNWGVKGAYYKENITDILKRDNIIATYSHLRRVNTPTSRKAKQPTIRLVAMSSLGYICPVETPEGENLGIVKNLTTGCYISVERDELPIRQEVMPHIQDDQDDTHMAKCILNGRFLGWCNGPALRDIAILNRRQGLFPRDTCIVLDIDDVLHLYCDGARPLRPLLIVDDGVMPLVGPNGVLTPEEQVAIKRAPGRLVIDELNLWNADMPTLLRHGCVEYVDAFEQDAIKLAYDLNNLNSIRGSLEYNENALRLARENVEKIQRGVPVHVQTIDETGVTKESEDLLTIDQANNRVKEIEDLIAGLRKKRPYTHCELDPQAILSISSSTIPFPHHDQGPRLVYECLDIKTPVVMADGTVKPLEEMKNGDSVVTIDPVTLQQSVTKIKNHFVIHSSLHNKRVFKVTTDDNRSLIATEDHKFLTNHGFQEAQFLKVGSMVAIYTDHVEYHPIASITEEPACMVGDFTTETSTHTFVAGDGFITHNCTMAKQALGIPGSNYQNRFDTTTKMLAFPTKPLFTPQIDSEIGLDELPVGQMAVIAIKTHKGANQEDAFNFNEGAIQRGFFRMIKYIVKKTTLKKTPEIEEMFEIPKFNPNDADRYANILKDGTPRVGAILRQNDCVIGKVVRIKSDNTKENASIAIGLSEEGIVDRVLKTTTDEGMLTIKVRIRQVRNPIVGDKFAPRHAQKGTIGILEKEHEMPFVKEGPNEGLIPSILINPHSIPSRMTIAMLIEIAQSRIVAMTGKRLNATAFRSYSLDQVLATLRQFGFDQYSNEKMISGLTGKEINTEIFMGECYYQALRHHVKDKIQMRSRGAVNPTTHQPVGGRIRRGGLRSTRPQWAIKCLLVVIIFE